MFDPETVQLLHRCLADVERARILGLLYSSPSFVSKTKVFERYNHGRAPHLKLSAGEVFSNLMDFERVGLAEANFHCGSYRLTKVGRELVRTLIAKSLSEVESRRRTFELSPASN